MDYNITMLDDLPDIDEIESNANHMYSNNNSIMSNEMYSKFKGNLRATREIPREAGMNTTKYVGDYTPVFNTNFPVTQVPQHLNAPMHMQNQFSYYTHPQLTQYMQQPQHVNAMFQESFTRQQNSGKPQMTEIAMSTEKHDYSKCRCVNTLKGYLVAIIILLIIFILLLLYFLRVINNLIIR